MDSCFTHCSARNCLVVKVAPDEVKDNCAENFTKLDDQSVCLHGEMSWIRMQSGDVAVKTILCCPKLNMMFQSRVQCANSSLNL